MWTRRQLLGGLIAAAIAAPPHRGSKGEIGDLGSASWREIRSLFNLDPELVHLGAMLIASHPLPVREAIDRHRRGLDENPVQYVTANFRKQRQRCVDLAARYFGAHPRAIALTDSTTMGLGLLYNGLRLESGDEILTTVHDYYSTRESLRYVAARRGTAVREARIYDSLESLSGEELVGRLVAAIERQTRVLALTWVHSDTGLALPIPAISEVVAAINESREPEERLLFCLDGVHGFGVFDTTIDELGCDFVAAGAHKWIFGPRGTGLLFAKAPSDFERLDPLIPPFGGKPTPGLARTPGGFHSFEHRWALAEALEFQLAVGKERIEARTLALAARLKTGLRQIERVQLHTPLDPAISAGIVCFDVDGHHPVSVLRALLGAGIVGTRAPYGSRSVRLTPSILNSDAEIDRALEVIESLA